MPNLKPFLAQFKEKITSVIDYQTNKFKQENPKVDFTSLAIYPVPSSSNFNSTMARILQYISINGMSPKCISSDILKKDFSKVEMDNDFIEKNKDYYTSPINDRLLHKTHLDNVETVLARFNAYKELKKRVEKINSLADEVMHRWNYMKSHNKIDNPKLLQDLYNRYNNYANYLSKLEQQDVYYDDKLKDKKTKLYFNNFIHHVTRSKKKSINDRSNEILNALCDGGLIKRDNRKNLILIAYYELDSPQIKSITNDVRMGLTNYFTYSDKKGFADKASKEHKDSIVVVFDDNISGGATLSDICDKLQKLGMKYIIPITFGEMPATYNMMSMPISAPKNGFNY